MYRIKKLYRGNVELEYNGRKHWLTDANSVLELTDEEYESIPPHKKYLEENNFIYVIRIPNLKKDKKK